VERTANLILAHDRLRSEMQMRERADAELLVAKQASREKRPSGRIPSSWPNMSTEIRTPITRSSGLTQVALQNGGHREQRECLELVRASGRVLLRHRQ